MEFLSIYWKNPINLHFYFSPLCITIDDTPTTSTGNTATSGFRKNPVSSAIKSTRKNNQLILLKFSLKVYVKHYLLVYDYWLNINITCKMQNFTYVVELYNDKCTYGE